MGLISEAFVTFLNISWQIITLADKNPTKDIILNNKNTESSLWKNFPNSIYLTARYIGKSCPLINLVLNISKTIATQIINKIDARKILTIATLVNLLGSFILEGRKYNKAIPPKEKIFVIPDKNKLSTPLPRIGYICVKSKFLVFPINIEVITIAEIGKKNRLALKTALWLRLQITPAPIINKRAI